MFKLLLLVSIILSTSNLSFAAQQSRSPHDEKIIDGGETTIEEYPYQVSILYNGNHICGGAIISNEYVVTAAHCTDGRSASGLSVHAGSSYLDSDGVIIPVSQYVQHPGYMSDALECDVSVLKLSTPLTYSASIQPIALRYQEIHEGAEVTFTGWGAVTEGAAASNQLRNVTVDVVSRSYCRSIYGTYRISENMICAEVAKKNLCEGDAGSPLTYARGLVGIASWGFTCSQNDRPAVYANVATLRSFIINNSDLTG